MRYSDEVPRVVRSPGTATPEQLVRHLQKGGVHIWTCAWESGCLPLPEQEIEMLLRDDENTALRRLQSDRVRRQRLLSRALLRSTLSMYAPRAPQEWIFEYGRYGRPVVPGSQISWPLRFNLSHTEDIAVCTVACDGDVGIDVETIIPDFPEDDCARRFTSAERAKMVLDKQNHKVSRFFDYWTLKEAYLKAIGLGLNGGLDRIAFSFDEGPGLFVYFNRPSGMDVGSWCFTLLTSGMVRCAIARRLPSCGGCDLRFFRAFSGDIEDAWSVVASAKAVLMRR